MMMTFISLTIHIPMEPTTSIDTKVTGTVPQVRVQGVNNYNVGKFNPINVEIIMIVKF